MATIPLRSTGNCPRQLAECGCIQNSCLLAVPAGRNPERDRRAMRGGPDVVTVVGLRTVDAYRIDCALIGRCHVRPVAVRPRRPEHNGDGARPCRPVLHLKAVKLSSRICDEIKRRVLRCRKQHRESFCLPSRHGLWRCPGRPCPSCGAWPLIPEQMDDRPPFAGIRLGWVASVIRFGSRSVITLAPVAQRIAQRISTP